MDFLEHPAVTDVVVCKTVLEEVGPGEGRLAWLPCGGPQWAGGGGKRMGRAHGPDSLVLTRVVCVLWWWWVWGGGEAHE